MGGLFLAVAINAFPVLRLRVGRDEGTLVATLSLRLRGTLLNLAALSLGFLLLATVTLYLIIENLQPY